MAVTEKRALEALPASGFLHDYVHYAAQTCDAHAAYHIGGGLAILAQTFPTELSISFGAPMRGNIYALVVGPSTESRKSVSISVARSVLQEALPDAIGEEPGSHEGLVEGLRAAPRQLICYSEFGEFLAKTASGYLLPVKTALTGCFDCAPLGRALAKSGKRQLVDPRLSLLAGCTLDYIERHTELADWTGGFMARFLTFHAERERTYDLPPESPVGREALVAMLRNYADGFASQHGPCDGLDPAARELWREWFYGTEKILKTEAQREVKGAVARAPSMAMKVALLLGWDYGGARRDQLGVHWRITPAELEPALRIVQLHIESVIEIGTRLASTRDMRDRRAVLLAIGELPTSLGVILRKSKLLKRRVKEIIDTLETEGVIARAAAPELRGEHFFKVAEVQGATEGGAQVIPLFGPQTVTIDDVAAPSVMSPPSSDDGTNFI